MADSKSVKTIPDNPDTQVESSSRHDTRRRSRQVGINTSNQSPSGRFRLKSNNMTDRRDPKSFPKSAVSPTKHARRSSKALKEVATNPDIVDDDNNDDDDDDDDDHQEDIDDADFDADTDFDFDTDVDIDELGSTDDEDFEDNDTFDNQSTKSGPRRCTLQRDRIAATESRVKRRDEVSELVARERELEDQFRHLSSCLDSLADEIYNLKSQLLQHTNCDCKLIQRYIAAETRKSIDMLAGAPFSDHTTNTPFGQSSLAGSSGDSISNPQYMPSSNSEYTPIPFINPFQQPSASADTMSNGISNTAPLPMDMMATMPDVDMASNPWLFEQQMLTSQYMPDCMNENDDYSLEHVPFNQ
ncbi:hypothetical protein PT974_02001 [Cladobotryum mycophilum]|uniref:BZIP domain-containing protein n=1 Tax=Cladobotryum mycophilum TaxID=491253 RepID=A0ABR0SXP6_9HYPO